MTKLDYTGREIARAESGTTNKREMRDSLGRVIAESFYDEQGKLKANAKGYATIRYELDKKGDQIVTCYFDVNGKAVVTNNCCA